MEVSGKLHTPVRFTPKERALGSHWIGGCVGPRAGLDAVVKRKILSEIAKYKRDYRIILEWILGK
jgi:hypothetical protein